MSATAKKTDWKLFTGSRMPHERIAAELPDPPKWRPMRAEVVCERQWPRPDDDDPWKRPGALARARTFHSTPAIAEIVNAALYLRRPLLVTGKPGSGKSSLVEAVAYELCLGAPLRWSVTSHSTLRDALYRYDAIGRLQDEQTDAATLAGGRADHATAPRTLGERIGRYIRLGPLGTALLPTMRPRGLLIDEIDKSDIDLPNDLLNVFEEGEFEIPELSRLASGGEVEVMTSDPGQPRARVKDGIVRCAQFPFIVLTSNGEREFPAPFLRRCLRLRMPNPTGNQPEDDNAEGKRLKRIVRLHFDTQEVKRAGSVIQRFVKLALDDGREVATDQLLNAVYFVIEAHDKPRAERTRVLEALMAELVQRKA